jgi:hypothetical protein
MTQHGQGDAPALTFEEVTEEGYAERAMTFDVLPTPDGVVFKGSCPRCGDTMEFAHVERVYRGLGRRRRASGREVVAVACTCTAEHPGRPGDDHGCGAYWNDVIDHGA